MSKPCGWCKQPSLQAVCIHCTRDIYICHNSVDCSWSHRDSDKRKGSFYCWNTTRTTANPIPETIEPSTTDDIPKPVNTKKYMAVVLATSKRAGKTYAEMLGIKNYRIVTARSEIEGLMIRAVVVTPGYYEKVEFAHYNATDLLRVLERTGMLTNAPIG